MKRWSMIAIICFILLFVLSIMTSKTEVIQYDHSSGIDVTILHEKKLFFIHSIQIEVYNGTGETILLQLPMTNFTIESGDRLLKVKDDRFQMKQVVADTKLSGQKETFWQFANSFQFTAKILYELAGEQQVIEISERLGEST